jgi:hypothetical protein
MLTHTGGSFAASADRHTGATHAAGDHPSNIKQVCRFILSALLAGGALAGIIALKTLAFLSHLHP